MSLKRGISGKKSPTVTPPDTIYTEPVNCQWDTCMKQFSSIPFLIYHIEKAHMPKEKMEDYVCLWKNCDRNKKPYKTRHSLIYHLRNHTGDKPHRCPYQGCNETFQRTNYLNYHIRREHTREKPYKGHMQGSSKSFNFSSNCSQNQKTHFDETSKVEAQTTPLIATHPEQYQCIAYTDNRCLQFPSPEFMISLPGISTIFDTQQLANSPFTTTQQPIMPQ